VVSGRGGDGPGGSPSPRARTGYGSHRRSFFSFSEIANVFWVRRRDGLTEAEAQAFWGELVHLPLDIVEVSYQLLFDGLTFSFREQVSPYDATFVVLARKLECDLITADGVLWRRVQATCPWVKLL
jgi:predicted nucleic acid-binding protein